MRETFAVGAGKVELTEDGAVAVVMHPSRVHSMLLEDAPEAPESAMHDSARATWTAPPGSSTGTTNSAAATSSPSTWAHCCMT